MKMKTFTILLLSTLSSLVTGHQAAGPAEEFNIIARDLITPLAKLDPRATHTASLGYTGDCATSFR